MAFEAGQIIGDYEVLDTLGSGGMGRVYRVRNVISNRVEAMKAVQPSPGAEPDFAARFSAEIRTLASFDHPNIAQLRTAFQFGDQQLMIMEFAEGSTLAQRVRENPLTQAEVVAITLQILSALSYAHSRGVVHRDVKPANVMVSSQGVAKLMDFGIAKSAYESQLTQPGSTIGSFYYMSPEQVRGLPVDARSDLYSVGVVLYQLLAGRLPFQAETTYALLNQQLNETPRPPVELNPHLPQGLNDLVLMALAKEPERRFLSADAFANALKAVSAETVVAAAAGTATYLAMPAAASASAPLSAVASSPRPAESASSYLGSTPAAPPRAATSAAAVQPAAKNHRALWVLGGALVVIAIFAAALVLAPRYLKTAAMSHAARPVSDTPAAASAAPAPAPATVDQPVQTSPAPPAAASSVAATSQDTAPLPAAVRSRRKSAAAAMPPSAREDAAPPVASPVPAQPDAAALAKTAEDLEQTQDELTKLNARASAVAASVERLQQQQAADGLGLRQDMAAAYSRMGSYLHAADSDLGEKNLAAAHRHIDLAEKEVATLESFFGK